jgi:hypothetical protein
MTALGSLVYDCRSIRSAGAGVTIADFVGDWRGVEVDSRGAPPEIDTSIEDLNVRITLDGKGFRIEGLTIGRMGRPAEATFAPTGQPGVYAFDPGGSSLFSSLFADPATGNPLEGDILLWSRLDGATLHIYALSIDDHGGFDLEHSTGTLEGDTMVVQSVVHMEDGRVARVEGRLVRLGG